MYVLYTYIVIYDGAILVYLYEVIQRQFFTVNQSNE